MFVRPREILLLDSGGTGNNFNEFFRDDGLSGSVVRLLELVDHLGGVLGRVIHSRHPRALFAAGVFFHGEINDGGELKLGARLKDVGVDGIVDVDAFGGGDVSITEDGLLRQDVRDDGPEFVVKQDSFVELEAAFEDGVGDGGGVVEGGRLPAVLLDLRLDGVGGGSLDDGSAFVADEEHLRLHVGRRRRHVILDVLVDARVDAAAKTSVGRDGDDELLGDGFRSFSPGFVVDVDGAGAVSARRFEAALGLGVFGRAHHLHGSGDLLDVTRTLQAHLNLLEGGHASD